MPRSRYSKIDRRPSVQTAKAQKPSKKPKKKPAVWIEPKGPKVGVEPVSPSKVAVGPPAWPVGWGIQVGEFKRKDPAVKAIRQARRAAPKILAHARNKVMSVERRGGMLYRARFVGLSRGDARLACRQLKRRKMGCLAMSPKKLQLAQLNN